MFRTWVRVPTTLNCVINSVVILAIGCARDKAGQPLRWEFAGSEVHVEGDAHEVGAGDDFVAEGSFRVVKAPTGDSQPMVVVKVLAQTKEGKQIIQNENGAQPFKKASGEFGYRAKLQAPTEPGTYTVETWLDGKRSTDAKVSVAAKPSG